MLVVKVRLRAAYDILKAWIGIFLPLIYFRILAEAEIEGRKDTVEVEDTKKEVVRESDISIPQPDRLETITADKDSSESEYNDSDVQSGKSLGTSDFE